MPITRESAARALDRHQLVVATSATALVVAVMFAFLGARAARTAAPVKLQLRQLQGASSSIADFKRGFTPATPDEQLRWNLSSETLALGVARSHRFSLAQHVSAQAEQLGLRDVRVRFDTSDSAMTSPARTGADGSSIPVARYALAVEFSGGFADALTFVKTLPATVAVERFSVARQADRSHFFVILAVYETADAKQPA